MKKRFRCPSCRSNSWRHFLEVNSFVIEECRVCGLGITVVGKRNFSSIAQDFYGEAYRKYYLSAETQRRLRERYRRIIHKLLPFFSRVRQVLDVGCSYGYFLKTAEGFGWKAVGLEPNAALLGFLKRKFPKSSVINSTLSKSRIRGKFDLLTYWDVLEHIRDLDKELKAVWLALRDGGYLLIHCPNKVSLGATISGSRWGWWSPPDHVYHFTLDSLVMLVKRAGFSPIAQWTYNDEEEVVRGLFNRFSPRSFPRLAAYFELGHQVLQRLGLPILYPLRLIEGKLGKAGLILFLAQRVEK